MTGPTREQRLNEVFVTLADTLVDGFDTVELLHTLVVSCTELLEVDAGGLLLANSDGRLQVVVSTSERPEVVEIMQTQADSGPCVLAFDTGTLVSVPDVEATLDRWPVFADAALARGFRSAYATPLRLRGSVLGAMALFSAERGTLGEQDLATARALADVATIGILQERTIRESAGVTEQLQRALDSRVVIEQAKGVLSALGATDPDEAFQRMRAYARQERTPLSEVAAAIASRTLDPASVLGPREA